MLKKPFLVPLALGVSLGLLIVSGLSCFSCVIYRESLTGHRLPTTKSEFKSHITPECPWVEGTLQGILGAPPYEPSQAGFDDIRDWVANNIDYMPDEKRWGEDYWQTPEETLSHSSGDCEDFSTLLCSLLRAYGIDAERVYVALGIDDEEYGHAFLIEDWYYDGQWRRIESQAPAQLSSRHSWLGHPRRHPDSELYEYEINAAFNDLYYYDESFPWDED
ncbi:MAG: transglutaminase domain-containing protein [Chloroflexota bacterium]